MTADQRSNAGRLSAAEEAELVRCAQQGDRAAMEALLRSFQNRVYTVCYRMLGHPEDAADLTQDTLTKLLVHLGRYDGRAALSTWVYRVAMNGCLSHRRKRRTISNHVATEAAMGGRDAGSLPDHGVTAEPGGADRVQHDERKRAALEALRRIPDEARALLILRDVRDLDYRQIAEALEIPVGTVKSRLFRARAMLRRELERLEEGAERDAEESMPEPVRTIGGRESS